VRFINYPWIAAETISAIPIITDAITIPSAMF
jgi:hypothetical protein